MNDIDAITDKQARYLKHLGCKELPNTKTEASKLIGSLLGTKEETYTKQCSCGKEFTTIYSSAIYCSKKCQKKISFRRRLQARKRQARKDKSE